MCVCACETQSSIREKERECVCVCVGRHVDSVYDTDTPLQQQPYPWRNLNLESYITLSQTGFNWFHPSKIVA